MQFSNEGAAQLNMCFNLLIEKMCSWRWLKFFEIKDYCSENFVIFAENYRWRSLQLKKLQYVES